MKSTLQQIKIVALGVILAAGLSYALAWTGPSSTPPNGNVAAPLNVGTSTQTKYGNLVLNGLSVSAATILSGVLQIPIGTPTPGEVLTAQDASGTVGWAAGGSASSSGPGIVYITPVTLVTVPDSNAISWTTISAATLTAAGVPSNATAVVLATNITGSNAQFNAKMWMRSSSAGQAYQLAGTETAGGGAPAIASFNQSVYPLSSSGTFDYSADRNIPGSTIVVVGYLTGDMSSINAQPNGVRSIIAGNNITITPSNGTGDVTVNANSSIVYSGTVGGGCYLSAEGGLINAQDQFDQVQYTCWGNATGAVSTAGPFGGGPVFTFSSSSPMSNSTSYSHVSFNCPSSYTQRIASETEIGDNNGAMMITGTQCIAN